jgi:hypothetical protein
LENEGIHLASEKTAALMGVGRVDASPSGGASSEAARSIPALGEEVHDASAAFAHKMLMQLSMGNHDPSELLTARTDDSKSKSSNDSSIKKTKAPIGKTKKSPAKAKSSAGTKTKTSTSVSHSSSSADASSYGGDMEAAVNSPSSTGTNKSSRSIPDRLRPPRIDTSLPVDYAAAAVATALVDGRFARSDNSGDPNHNSNGSAGVSIGEKDKNSSLIIDILQGGVKMSPMANHMRIIVPSKPKGIVDTVGKANKKGKEKEKTKRSSSSDKDDPPAKKRKVGLKSVDQSCMVHFSAN